MSHASLPLPHARRGVRSLSIDEPSAEPSVSPSDALPQALRSVNLASLPEGRAAEGMLESQTQTSARPAHGVEAEVRAIRELWRGHVPVLVCGKACAWSFGAS